MRIVPAITLLILTLATTDGFARRSRCRPGVYQCVPAVCSGAGLCIKPARECRSPKPTEIVLAEKPAPVPMASPVETKPAVVRLPRPASIDLVDPKLNDYLADWERASSQIARLDCEFRKFMYDPIFEVERRGRGTLALERDRRARYRVVSAALKPGEVSEKTRKDGSQYELRVCTAECWHWTGARLFRFDDQEHSYEEMSLAPADTKLLFWNFQFTDDTDEQLGLLFLKPFVLGMPADQLRKRFKVRIIKETADELWLELTPRQAEESGNCPKALLVLNRQTWLTQALKMFDPTGCQVVHVFQNVKVNSPAAEDLSKPNLEDYQEIRWNDRPKSETSK